MLIDWKSDELAELPEADQRRTGSYGGIGIHSMLAIHKMVPGYFTSTLKELPITFTPQPIR